MSEVLGRVLQREACTAEQLGKIEKYVMMYLL
jgi:hypothetical protein